MKIAALLFLLVSILVIAGLAFIAAGWIELLGRQAPLEPVRFEPLNVPAAAARPAPAEESPTTRTVVAGDSSADGGGTGAFRGSHPGHPVISISSYASSPAGPSSCR